MRRLERRQFVPRPREEVFAFFDRPENLALLTPPDMGFKVMNAGRVEMKAGAAIEYRVNVFGAPLRWESRIAAYEPGRSFCDVQETGPYRAWTHTHHFVDAPGGTEIVDQIDYELPLHPLSAPAAPLVARELERIFEYRKRAVERLFGGQRRVGDKNMKIAITGSTGFIGRALAEALIARGDQVVALGRGETAGVDGMDAVVNLAGENIAAGRWTAARKRAILESRVNGTRALVEAIHKCSNPPRLLVNASAVGFYGGSPAGEVDEHSAKGSGFLADVCAAWEAEAVRAESATRRVVRLRLGVVLGKGGGALPRMALPFKLFAGGPVGSGEQPVPWIHLDDAVGAILHALDTPTLQGAVVAVAPGAPSQREFARALGKALSRPSWAPAPAFALKLALGEMSDLVLGGQRAEPKALLASGYRFKRPELDDALKASL